MAASRWNLANLLTLCRLPLAAAGAYFLWGREYPGVGVAFLAAAALTDILDGVAARALNQITDFGKKIDPIADKISIAAVGVVLVLRYGVPWWIFAVAVARDVAILISAAIIISRREVVVPSNFWGKAAALMMVLYGIAAVVATGSWITVVLMWLVLAAIIISTASYGYDFYRVLSSGAPGRREK
ncbi:MAG: CDP-alcohol phosphatidyltransferase family protein [Candidatus Zixiibacteriota bacterium]|jgi:CDP-diacylglycerol--glycerol-3-phosphate 3-phosphatidyltransferase